MYQESDDRLRLSIKHDTVLVILLIISFFLIGGIATYLRRVFDSPLPIYALVVVVAATVYVLYRVRILGFRYTIFHTAPTPEFDERFDDYIVHEDYPYPVGTFVVERTTSAKGTIVETVSKDEIVELIEPRTEYAADEEIVYCSHKKEVAHSLIVKRNGKLIRMYIRPSDELVALIKKVIEA